ncbi:6-carboxytetrahydropterin synthase [Micrococcus sp.]|uniref:6-pyruvoyl trahydropterin synthase family protein n=1 Tax=Micrococcus sp. TaxID=1271 RepID=UPI002A91BFEB|nr:6-carboxytetrahydropterin synthase [Micrococcus sp.]MDY6055169.1 6-carboxytetrahydropterin synthase [Micrococcus sp.]
MYAEISKDFDFSASHRLDGLPRVHQCSRLHGHNYRVRLSIVGSIVEPGFVVDYGELAFFKRWMDETLDHRHLNDVMDSNPTAENLAAWMASLVGERLRAMGHKNVTMIKVSVSETPKTWAMVTRTMVPRALEGEM